jgi:hypothetical protein
MMPSSSLARALSDSLSDIEQQEQGGLVTRLQPRVNNGTTGPPARQRLDLRLDMYGLVERTIKGDGNCQFRALADQLYSTQRLHAFVRERVAWRLRAFPGVYSAFVPGDYDAYCEAMARSGEWGDHVTLQVGCGGGERRERSAAPAPACPAAVPAQPWQPWRQRGHTTEAPCRRPPMFLG